MKKKESLIKDINRRRYLVELTFRALLLGQESKVAKHNKCKRSKRQLQKVKLIIINNNNNNNNNSNNNNNNSFFYNNPCFLFKITQ